jgi:hypothetical protein
MTRRFGTLRNKDIKKLKLRVIGNCTVCHKQFFLEPRYGTIPKHGTCEGAEYGPDKAEYQVESLSQAIAISNLLIEDDGACLDGGMYHNIACGDGNSCDEERRRLSSALAKYFLEHNPI